MASQTADQGFSDVRKVGYLRKPKSMHRRFFVLRIASASGPSRLEYYENEKKWRHKSVAPKRSIPLERCLNINKRADSKNKYLVALYTKEEYFAVAADNEQEQEQWYQALLDVHNRGKIHGQAGGGTCGDRHEADDSPGPAFREVWQVVLKPKGLGHAKNLIGIYRLCLTNKTISLVKLNSDVAAVVLQLMNIRRCGHSESYFFVEVGRSAVTGPGEFWMQADDSVVAQNMHETILEAMRAMSDEFHPRSKSQGGSSSSSKCSTPISVPLRRHHHHGHPPPSQVGLGRRSRTESAAATSPAASIRQTRPFRVRASSDGEGTMSRPASEDGSPISPTPGRANSQRRRASGPRLHPPLSHSRSIPTPSSTSTVSPVSLSSSGRGSASDCPYPSLRRRSTTPSGSPSDGGFVSSDEYGSSPHSSDFRGSAAFFRSATPDSSLGHTPPHAREEEFSNYMSMAKPGGVTTAVAKASGGHSPDPVHHSYVTSPSQPEELEKSFRKRTHTHTPPPAAAHHKALSHSPSSSLDEYAPMTPGYRHLNFPLAELYHKELLDLHVQSGEARSGETFEARRGDDGYMPMSPGVVPTSSGRSDDYMPMNPKTMSAPQQILDLRTHRMVDSSGYMMMSPGDTGGGGQSAKVWSGAGGVNISEGKGSCGDYISMSPASSSTNSTPPPDCYLDPTPPPAEEEPPPSGGSCYYSLPRSYRHAPRKQSPLKVLLGPAHSVYQDSSSSSASSDSLGPQDSGGRLISRTSRGMGTRVQTRPTRLSLDLARASTLPRARDSPFPSPEPSSPGEYVSMEFGDRPFCASLISFLSPAFSEDGSPLDGHTQHPFDNATLEPEAASSDPGFAGETLRIPAVVPGTGPVLSAFSSIHPGPDQNQGARVVRIDPQVRQRQLSGTFGAGSGKVEAQPRRWASSDDAKMRSCTSFEDAWSTSAAVVRGRGERPVAAAGASSSSSSSLAHDLNYMDLDLGKVPEQLEWPSTENLSEEENVYVSISYPEPEHINRDCTHREE
ncbi:hypothetical protein GJAV_G00123580 [Gymnothorax javanicus]|nr:hypothetical protein GJAV_G00123580 [Gymnothorax javanicus]